MNKKYIFSVAVAGFMLASCADEFDPQIAPVQAPVDAAKQAELADLKPLKEYVDRTAHPDFKISGALSADDFNKKTDLYHVASTNFDEIVAGNAMKMASVVNDKGEFNYSTVSQFVQSADEAGLTIYGHTLAWHAQQPRKWLDKLIADKPKPKDPNAAKQEVTDFLLDCATVSGYSWSGSPATVTTEWNQDGAMVITNPSPTPNFWELQYWIVNGINLTEGNTYKMTINCKAEGDADALIRFKLGDWGGGFEKQFTIPANGDFADITFDVTPTMASSGLFCQHGDFVGKIYWKSFKISHEEEVNDDVEYQDVWTQEDCQFIARDENITDEAAQVLPGEGPDGIDAIKIVGKTNVGTPWDTQFFIYTPNKKWEAGEKYRLHMWYKATKAIGTDSQVHSTPGNYKHWQMLSPNPEFTTEWQEKTWTGTIPAEGGGAQQSIAFNLNKGYTGDVTDPVTMKTVDQIDYYFAGITWESYSQIEVPKKEELHFDKRCIIVESEDMAADPWDTQFWIQTNQPFHSGDAWEFTAELRADAECAPGTQIHKGSAGGYIHWAAIGNPAFSTEWETVKLSGNIPAEGEGGDFIAWNLNDYASANKFYIGSISFKINGVEMLNNGDLSTDDISSFWKKEKRGATVHAPISDGYTIIREVKTTIPLTEEEKHDTLVYAMNKWISGMMEATEGKVKAWDLVNEAISGGGDVEGFYALQHGSEDNKTDFFWQDYLGDLDYVRQAARIARASYASTLKSLDLQDDGKLKLFINDYNLESDWDQNKKIKSLIYWISKWEEDGVTKIDGIGTQMHISYYENAKTQKSKEDAIVEMFKLMAATGKLVRISELDMGYVDKDGKTIGWADMVNDVETGYEREKKMEAFYQWIIQKYFEIVPAAQQYGICQWCLTDASGKVGDAGGWRPGEPVGLWDTNWYRKYTYRGYVNGLQGK